MAEQPSARKGTRYCHVVEHHRPRQQLQLRLQHGDCHVYSYTNAYRPESDAYIYSHTTPTATATFTPTATATFTPTPTPTVPGPTPTSTVHQRLCHSIKCHCLHLRHHQQSQSDAYIPHANSDSYIYTHGDCHVYCYANAYSRESDAYIYSYAYANSDSYVYTNGNCWVYSDCYGYGYGNCYSHAYANSNSDVYPDCYSYGNDTAYAESDGYGHAKANTDAEAAFDAEAASDTDTEAKHFAIKTVVDVLAALGDDGPRIEWLNLKVEWRTCKLNGHRCAFRHERDADDLVCPQPRGQDCPRHAIVGQPPSVAGAGDAPALQFRFLPSCHRKRCEPRCHVRSPLHPSLRRSPTFVTCHNFNSKVQRRCG